MCVCMCEGQGSSLSATTNKTSWFVAVADSPAAEEQSAKHNQWPREKTQQGLLITKCALFTVLVDCLLA